MNIVIRDLEIEDLAAIFETVGNSVNVTLEQLTENLTKRISCEEITVIALIDDKIAGIVCSTIDHKLIGGNVAFVEDLYVFPEFRNQGIGTLLGEYILSRVWDLGCKKALSYTGIENISSNKVHKKVGAVITGQYCWKYTKQGVL